VEGVAAAAFDTRAQIRRARGVTVVLVTHDTTITARADRVVTMLDARAVTAAAAPQEAALVLR
jgi:predicted ABC-type transport system involved in lysophospholipase L1 biosynthesis ATPase subunit